MHFLVIDTRFAAAVHVFLETDPRAEAEFPRGLSVQDVTLEPDKPLPGSTGSGIGSGQTVGQDSERPRRFREFASDREASRAGFTVIEPRFVGPTWVSYQRTFGFGERKVRARS